MMIMKFRSMKLTRSFSKIRCGKMNENNKKKSDRVTLQGHIANINADVKWELRPGGMLVQKRDIEHNSVEGGVMVVRVATGSQLHDISIQPTSTFGELKMLLSMVTSLDPKEQRVLFKGKERGDEEFLHMVGVKDKDKVLMLQDPATRGRNLFMNHECHGSSLSYS